MGGLCLNGFDYNLSPWFYKYVFFNGISARNYWYITSYSNFDKLPCPTDVRFHTEKFIPLLIFTFIAAIWWCCQFKVFVVNTYIVLSTNLNLIKDFLKNFFFLKLYIKNVNNIWKEVIYIDSLLQSKWYLSLLFILTGYNLLSLLPKINNIITIISIPTFCAIWLFFIQNFMGILVNKEIWLFNFYPTKLLYKIAPFIIYIEQFSYFIKPISLSIRIFANMLAGHMLVHILSNYGHLFFLVDIN
jgi:F0F1-type ATP synthase membrane subunit a